MNRYTILEETEDYIIIKVCSDSRENVNSKVAVQDVLNYVKEHLNLHTVAFADVFNETAVYPVDENDNIIVDGDGQLKPGVRLAGFCRDYKLYKRV